MSGEADEGPEKEPITVLVVDDDPVVRRFTTNTLRTDGYTVIEAEDGNSAIRAAKRFGVPIRLLLTDYVMPDFDGHELARRLTPDHPEMRVLYISGHIEDEVVQKGVLEGAFKEGAQFLQKPFTGEELCRKVKAVLKGL